MIKQCTICNKEKPITCFHKGKGYKDGIRSSCKDCRKIEKLNYRLKNHKKISMTHHKYYLEHKELISNYQKNYRKTNKEKRKLIMKRSDLKCKQRIKRYKNQPCIKIAHNLRNRIRFILIGYSKSSSTISLLGCTLEELKQYLESQFKPEMTWKNYGIGGWEIDHIRPCASFDLSDSNQQKQCFHYTNLQPLWFNENRAKNHHKVDS